MIVIDRRAALMQLLGTAALSGFAGVTPSFAQANAGRAELLMFDDPGCPYCRKWHSEVASAYRNSPEGRLAPLRVLQVRAGRPEGVTLASPVRYTPTFVLVQDGREIGRVNGYGGADFFWGQLEPLIKKLRPGERAT
jgi:hypothetical protein